MTSVSFCLRARGTGVIRFSVRMTAGNRAVVGAGLCGRWSPIVRSLELNRAVVAEALCGHLCSIVQKHPDSTFQKLAG